MTIDDATKLVKERIEAGASPFDIEEHLLGLGLPSAVIGVAFERAAGEFRDSAQQLTREADQLEAMHASA